MLTARKRVRPIPACILSWRCVSHHSLDHHSSLDSSSFSSPSDHSLSGHTPPDTTNADSSTPQRFVYQSLARTPRRSEAFRCWRSAPLSTPYPPTTSESSLGSSSKRSLDSSLLSSRPSRKRCRRLEIHIEVDTAYAEGVADVGISEGVVAHLEDGVGIGFEIAASDVREDDEEFKVETSAADTREIAVDPLAIRDNFESSRGVASRERASLVKRIGSLRLKYLKVRAMLSIERDQIDSLCWHMALSHEEFCQVCRDRDDTQRRLKRLESTMTITCSCVTPKAIEELVNPYVEEALAAHEATHTANALEAENQIQNGSDGDNGNGGNGNGGNGNPNENGRGDRPVARECTYQDFMKCQPLNFKGTEGVVGLIRTETAFAMSWRELMKLMTENNDLAAYTQRFQELTMMYTKMVPEEEDQGYVVKNAENKRSLEVNQRDNHRQQPPFKRPNVGCQNVARAYTAGNNERKPYNGPLPLCNKCKLHHKGPCTMRCRKCNKVGHLTRDCKVTNSTTSTQRGQIVNQRVLTCFKCGRQGHYRSDYPKLKDQNHGNKAGNKNGVGEARGKAYVLGGGDTNPDSNVVK
ncbi:putative reverse transcriptase domain-containing protein, partial [Tanacetum coccineum]